MKIIKSLLAVGLIALSPIAHAQDKDMLDVKIGQMLMIGFPKAEVDPVLLEEIRAGKVGAVIFFEKNIPKSASAFAPMKKIIWTYQHAAPIPLMIAIDQEGGKVQRIGSSKGLQVPLLSSNLSTVKRLFGETSSTTSDSCSCLKALLNPCSVDAFVSIW